MKATLALPTGSLQKTTRQVFVRARLLEQDAEGRLYWEVINTRKFKLKVAWLNPRDIPWAIRTGFVNAGICGADVYGDWSTKHSDHLWEIGRFGYSKRGVGHQPYLALIAPNDFYETEAPRQFRGDVVSDYPYLTGRLLPQASVVATRGSVEALIPRMAGHGVTVIDSGETLRANKLREVQFLWHAFPTLYASARCHGIWSLLWEHLVSSDPGGIGLQDPPG